MIKVDRFLLNNGGDGDGGGSGPVNPSTIGQKIVGDILKKAVNIGATAVERAESTVNKTLALHPTNISKEMIRDVLESFFENYTIHVNAEIKLKPKNKDSSESKARDEESKK